MFTEERQAAIIQCLQEKGKVKVKSLSEKFHVSGLYPKRPEDPGKFRKTEKNLWRGDHVSGLPPPERRY